MSSKQTLSLYFQMDIVMSIRSDSFQSNNSIHEFIDMNVQDVFQFENAVSKFDFKRIDWIEWFYIYLWIYDLR